jgi:RND family efflux transporter MFP subunit
MKYSNINMKKHYLTAVVIMIFQFLLSGCDHKNVDTDTPPPSDSKIQSVEVVKPEYRSFLSEVLITGTAHPYQQVSIVAMESGYLHKIYKDIGDVVTKGEVIAEIDNPTLIHKREMLTAQLELKKAVYDRLKKTHSETPALTPLQVLEEAKAEYLVINAELNDVNDRIGFLKIKAPFVGVITRRMVDVGVLVQSGLSNSDAMPLFEIQNISTIRLVVPMPEANALAAKNGMEVSVSFPELPGKSFNEKISRTSNSLDLRSKTMDVQIDIANKNYKIKPGMYAKVLLKINSRDSVLSLPLTAQVVYEDEYFIFLIKNNKVMRTELRKGLSNKDYFEILNDNITAKSHVIVQGKSLVKDGQTINPVLKK